MDTKLMLCSASPQDEDTAGPPTFFPMMPDPPAIPFTAEEATKINEQLAQRLGPEWISSRPGPGGGKLHYLPGENAILLANEIFGFNGWSLSIRKSHMTHVSAADALSGDNLTGGSVMVPAVISSTLASMSRFALD